MPMYISVTPHFWNVPLFCYLQLRDVNADVATRTEVFRGDNQFCGREKRNKRVTRLLFPPSVTPFCTAC